MVSARGRWLIGQVVLWGLGIALLRVVVVPAESCPPVGPQSAGSAIDAGAAWLARGQGPDGRFLYGYRSDTDESSPDYNTTRHAGVMDALYRAGRADAADGGLAYVLRNTVRHEGWTAFAPLPENATAGANALLLVAL